MAAHHVRFRDLFCIFLSGSGIGCLMGLSASPVLGGVLTSIVTVATSVTAVMVGINHDEAEEAKKKFTPAPAMLLILGIVVGSLSGIKMRATDCLSPKPQDIVAKWKGDGLTEADIRKRMFDQFYPATKNDSEEGKDKDTDEEGKDKGKEDKGKSKIDSAKDKDKGKAGTGGTHVTTQLTTLKTVLFASTFDEVQSFLQHLDVSDTLRDQMKNGSDDHVSHYAINCHNPEDLRIAVEELIWPTVRLSKPNQSVEQSRASSPIILGSDECTRYKKEKEEKGDVLREDMKRSTSVCVAVFALRCKDEADLKLAVEDLICGS